MSATMKALATPPTVADLVKDLGDVPLWRVYVLPPPGTATEADILEVRDLTKRICELVDGTLVEKGMSYRASMVGVFVSGRMDDFVRTQNLGIVAGEAGMLRIAAGLVRVPDVSFVSWDRIPGGEVPAAPIPGLVPNLAVEVLSPSNTASEMVRKRRDYFRTGVEVVWMIDPDSRTAEVFSSENDSTALSESDWLDGKAMLPGFRLSLAEMFATLDRKAPTKP